MAEQDVFSSKHFWDLERGTLDEARDLFFRKKDALDFLAQLTLNVRGERALILYGYGVLGKAICRDLRGSHIKVVAILVTAVAAYGVIEKALRGRGCHDILDASGIIGSDVGVLGEGVQGKQEKHGNDAK